MKCKKCERESEFATCLACWYGESESPLTLADALQDVGVLVERLESAAEENERLRVHKRALEGVLRARVRMNEEIDRKLQELGLAGGEGDG